MDYDITTLGVTDILPKNFSVMECLVRAVNKKIWSDPNYRGGEYLHIESISHCTYRFIEPAQDITAISFWDNGSSVIDVANNKVKTADNYNDYCNKEVTFHFKDGSQKTSKFYAFDIGKIFKEKTNNHTQIIPIVGLFTKERVLDYLYEEFGIHPEGLDVVFEDSNPYKKKIKIVARPESLYSGEINYSQVVGKARFGFKYRPSPLKEAVLMNTYLENRPELAPNKNPLFYIENYNQYDMATNNRPKNFFGRTGGGTVGYNIFDALYGVTQSMPEYRWMTYSLGQRNYHYTPPNHESIYIPIISNGTDNTPVVNFRSPQDNTHVSSYITTYYSYYDSILPYSPNYDSRNNYRRKFYKYVFKNFGKVIALPYKSGLMTGGHSFLENIDTEVMIFHRTSKGADAATRDVLFNKLNKIYVDKNLSLIAFYYNFYTSSDSFSAQWASSEDKVRQFFKLQHGITLHKIDLGD